MAQEPGRRLSVGQKVARWALQKMAVYTGAQLSLKDPAGWDFLSGSSAAGKAVNDTTAMQVSAVYSCVRILSESVGQLPWGVYERQKNGNAEKIDHPLAEILVQSPNADMTSVEFREATQANLGMRGNGYNLIERRANGDILSLYPLPATQIQPYRKPDGEIRYKFNDRGRQDDLPRDKIWHLKGFGPTGLVGYSPIGVMRNAIGLAIAAEEFGSNVFANGAHPSAVVKIPTWLKDDQRDAAKKNLKELWAGLENAHKLMLLEGGMEFDKSAAIIPPEDLQLLGLRRFQVTEICRLYGIPPHMVAELERATFSNIEEMSIEFVMFTLLPWLRRWESSANRWLLKPGDRSKYFVAFNFDGLLRADTAARSEYIRTMVSNGLMSRNEARAKENMNRSDAAGMDDYTVQSNMISVDDLGALADSIRSKGNAPKWAPIREAA